MIYPATPICPTARPLVLARGIAKRPARAASFCFAPAADAARWRSAALLAREASAATISHGPANPLAPKPPQFPATAKNVIWCFLDGGPSHLDLFDPKPMLAKLAGKPLPSSFKRPVTAMGTTAHTPLMASRRKFLRRGQSGIPVSDWYPQIAECVDDLTMIHSVRADGLTHVASVGQMNTGNILAGRPSVGAWTLYGLGTRVRQSARLRRALRLPARSAGRQPQLGHRLHAGHVSRDEISRRRHADLERRPADVREPARAAHRVGLHRATRSPPFCSTPRRRGIGSPHRGVRIGLPNAIGRAGSRRSLTETAETHELYGLGHAGTADNGRNCLIARRLVERGVRFVQIYMGSGSRWDAHSHLEENHARYCQESDRPIAGLLQDLKRRGLLESTLVIWGGEFGRTPMSESGSGRDHNPYGFTMWMAGGGVRSGFTFGATDEIGLYAVENPVHVHDIHATILHLLGLNHTRTDVPARRPRRTPDRHRGAGDLRSHRLTRIIHTSLKR